MLSQGRCLKYFSRILYALYKKGGLFISYKGPAAQDEMEKARKAMDILGGKDACSIKDAYVPYSDKTRKLILVKKITLSPKKYPRSPGKIKKSPL